MFTAAEQPLTDAGGVRRPRHIYERSTTKNMWKFIKKLFSVIITVVVVLFVVYFWNLDQKVLGWAYKQVNTMFDRKKVDLVF